MAQSAWRVCIHEPIIWRMVGLYNSLHLDRLGVATQPGVAAVDPDVVIQ